MATGMRNNPYTQRHFHQRVARDADQAEFNALLKKATVVDAGVYDGRVAGAMDDFDPGDSTVTVEWHRRDLEYDTATGLVSEEIERRTRILADAYPFAINGGQLKYLGSVNRVYEFCLATCNAP